MDISVTVCLLCVCVFVRLRIFQPKIKLSASYFARRFIGVRGRESPILGNFAPQNAKIGRIGERAGHAHPHVNIRDEGVVTTRTQSNEFRVVTSSNEYLSPRNIVTEYLSSND